MYLTDSLQNRIGWEQPQTSNVAVIIDNINSTATSGRKVNSFHALATVDNLFLGINKTNETSEKFNQLLLSIRNQSVTDITTVIFDQHTGYIDSFDYTPLILARPKIFDEAIGYSMAIRVLEILATSKRINENQENTNLTFQMLKLELEGIKNESGLIVSTGIISKKETAIRKAQKVIFNEVAQVKSGKSW